MAKPIYVTQPSLPPLDEFIPYLQQIWDSKILTNGGAMHRQLEDALCEYLGVEHIALFNNGTIALLTALKALNITGEVITTPYSFVATSHALLWNGLKPIFVDIDPQTFNIDPAKIERAITAETSAIMPVHCYGNPCNVEAIGRIAGKHGLKVIYDAAHAFGVEDGRGSILRYGDLSVLSFHATKVFNTFEGGAIVCPDAQTKQQINFLKNFGFANETTVVSSGINGKMCEVSAAFGLLQLKQIDACMERNAAIAKFYRESLQNVRGIVTFDTPEGVKRHNNSYFPILIRREYPLDRDGLYERLKEANIYSRRYFYPLISEFSMYRNLPSANSKDLQNAKEISESILCLPIYPGLLDDQINKCIRGITGGRFPN